MKKQTQQNIINITQGKLLKKNTNNNQQQITDKLSYNIKYHQHNTTKNENKQAEKQG